MILLQNIDKVTERELVFLESFFTVVFVVEIVKDALISDMGEH